MYKVVVIMHFVMCALLKINFVVIIRMLLGWVPFFFFALFVRYLLVYGTCIFMYIKKLVCLSISLLTISPVNTLLSPSHMECWIYMGRLSLLIMQKFAAATEFQFLFLIGRFFNTVRASNTSGGALLCALT